MVFSSSEFLFGFLPAFLLLYGLCPRVGRSLLIALASFVFYGWWEPWFVLLLFGSSALDFWIGRRIAAAQQNGRRGGNWLTLSVVANLSLLGWFKYANFGVATFKALLQSFGWQGELPWVDVVLPVGISFYTFQTLSYTIDLYRREVRPARSFVDFVCYVSMFPQLVAGPIVRYAVVERELTDRRHSLAAVRHGVLLFQIGLCKKLLLADALAPVADSAFGVADPTGLGVFGAWLGVLAYAFQIYFDFSGYSDMAIGLGRMLGFHFPINFDAPYKSASITEFWRRWHISLSTWLRDYLYVPLGGNRKGPVRTYINLALTMLLGGLWHGAAWNFVAWGAYQGGWLIVERRLGKRSWYGPLPLPLRILLTFALVLVGWVFFRARDLGHAFEYLRAMGGAGGVRLGLDVSATVAEFAAAALIVWCLPTSQRLANAPRWWFVILLQVAFGLAALHLRLRPENIPFLYFRF